MTIDAVNITDITRYVTQQWTKQRKAEERGARSRASRRYIYSKRVDFTDVAADILPGGFLHASGDGKYTVDKRQFYYAVRDEFLKRTGREITADYFSQNLLVKYMNQHPREKASWKITASPRGTLTIPNASYDLRIPCGTVAIEEFLHQAAQACAPFDDVEDIGVETQWPSLAEGQRYQGVLYIEKEGFDPQLREARLADHLDLAIISCKGQSVVAARMYVDHVCRALGGVPLFVAHDLDKAGFEISQRLTSISDHARENDLVKYEFRNTIRVIDLGLRLTDVQKYGLKSEQCQFKGYFASDTIATPEEQRFLRSHRRVELNAFTAPQFIEWLETALRNNGLNQRLIPNDDILTVAYRHALAVAAINKAIQETRANAIADAKAATIPRDLRQQLESRLSNEGPAWDSILYDIAEKSLLS